MVVGSWHRSSSSASGTWQPTTLDRGEHLSFYFCSGHDVATSTGRQVDDDIADVGCVS